MTGETLDLVLKAMIAAGSLLAAFMAWQAKKAVQEVHVSLNSRLTQLLEATAAASRAEGRDSMDDNRPGPP